MWYISAPLLRARGIAEARYPCAVALSSPSSAVLWGANSVDFGWVAEVPCAVKNELCGFLFLRFFFLLLFLLFLLGGIFALCFSPLDLSASCTMIFSINSCN
jgi:hypothetical protein